MSGFAVEPLAAGLAFGKRVIGLRHDHLADEATCAMLRRMWIDDGLVLFRDGDTSAAFQIALSRVFGPLDRHPVKEVENSDNPELITVASEPGKGTVFDVDGVTCGAWLAWHSDLVYHDRINHGGILRAVRLTSWGGRTGFIDQIDAYDRLPDRLKAEIEGLGVVYQMCQITGSPYATRSAVRLLKVADFTQRLMDRVDVDFPPVVHPLVFVQAETGRKVLNYSPRFAKRVDGLDAAASDALLREVIAHNTRPELSYFHEWVPGEMVLWDNWRMLHCVSGAPADETRIMQRTTIAGDYALGRKLAAAA